MSFSRLLRILLSDGLENADFTHDPVVCVVGVIRLNAPVMPLAAIARIARRHALLRGRKSKSR